MAATARVTGKITYIETREGVKDGRPWQMKNATVFVGERGVAEVTLPRPENFGGRVFSEGEEVDLLVSFDVYGSRLSTSVIGDYPKHLREAEADLLTFSGAPADSLA